MKDEALRAQVVEAIQQLVNKFGEDALADGLMELASKTLMLAASLLHSTPWWTDTLKAAVMNKKEYDSALLCKLLDKAVPTPQTIKLGAEEGFRLVIVQENASAPQEKPHGKKPRK